MRWESGTSEWARVRCRGLCWSCFMAREEEKWRQYSQDSPPADTLVMLLSPWTTMKCSSVCLVSEYGGHYTDQEKEKEKKKRKRKKHCIPFCSALLRIRGGSEPRRPMGTHFPGNEVLSGAAVSLCGWQARLYLWFLFDPDRTKGRAVRLCRAGAGAQGTARVVAGAAEAAFQGGGDERPSLVIPAKWARAEVTEGRGRGAANAAVVPWTFPASCIQTEASMEKE